MERATLHHARRGPRTVELTRQGPRLTRAFGRSGVLSGQRHDVFATDAEATLAMDRQVSRLIRKGYLPGHHSPDLVAAIRADWDPGGYGVYADWLLERGDPRGELIHVQMRLAESPDDAALQRVAEGIMRTYRPQLLESSWVQGQTPRWRFGFVDGLAYESPHSGEYYWPIKWLEGQLLRPQSPGWITLRNVLRHPSGALLRWVSETRGRPYERGPAFVRYRVAYDPAAPDEIGLLPE